MSQGFVLTAAEALLLEMIQEEVAHVQRVAQVRMRTILASRDIDPDTPGKFTKRGHEVCWESTA